MDLLTDKSSARWYKLKKHPVQLSLVGAVDRGVRFPLVPSGRRSGKTERFKRFIAKKAMKIPGLYFAAAPTHDQAKKIFWQDLKLFTFAHLHNKRPSESDRIIYLPNGSEIHVIGLDKPQRIEGIPWKGGGIDEFADIKEHAWGENIYPALSTVNPLDPGYLPFCWLLGVPDGLNHYYRLCQDAGSGGSDEFEVFHWKTSEVFPDMAARAKKTLSERQYNQEFNASFETATGRIYSNYSSANYTSEVIKPHERLLWSHDQNFTPLSSSISVLRGDDLYFLDEIVLTSAVSRQSAIEFVDKYKNHQNKEVWIFGDPAGRAGEKHGHASDYIEIENILREHGWTFIRKVEKKAPAIKDRQNSVRAKICTADKTIGLYVNRKTAKWCHEGLATVQLQEGSSFQEDQKNQYQHITTAIGYQIDYMFPIRTNLNSRKSSSGDKVDAWGRRKKGGSSWRT